MKKFLSLILVFIMCISSSFYCYASGTSTSEPTEKQLAFFDANGDGQLSLAETDLLTYIIYYVTSMGNLFTLNLEQQIKDSIAYNNYLLGVEGNEEDTIVGEIDSNGYLIVADSIVELAKSFLNESKSNEGYVAYPALPTDRMYYYDELGCNFSVSSLNSYLASGDFVVGCPVMKTTYYRFPRLNDGFYNNLSQLILIDNGSMICAYRFDDNQFISTFGMTKIYCDELSSSGYSTSSLWVSGSSSFNYISSSSSFTGLVGMSCLVFDSASSAYKYYTYDRNFFNSSKNYDVPKISLDTLNNTDWSGLNYSAYCSIKDSLDSSMTDEEVQALIDIYVQKIVDSIGSVSEGIYTGNESLEDILDAIVLDGERQSSWLARIYTLLGDYFPLIVNSSGGASSDDLERIIELLEKNVDTLEDIEKDTTAIKGLLALDTTLDFFSLLSTEISGVTSEMKTKFPTSIPWDIIALVTVMAREPEAPIFDIPIVVQSVGIEENIHIDLSENSSVSDMSMISNISRAMLSILFVFYLIILTKNLFGGD